MADDIDKFRRRLFSGHDLLQLMDWVQVGAGATMALVRRAEIDHERYPGIYRALDGPTDEDLVAIVEGVMDLQRYRRSAIGEDLAYAVTAELGDRVNSLPDWRK